MSSCNKISINKQRQSDKIIKCDLCGTDCWSVTYFEGETKVTEPGAWVGRSAMAWQLEEDWLWFSLNTHLMQFCVHIYCNKGVLLSSSYTESPFHLGSVAVLSLWKLCKLWITCCMTNFISLIFPEKPHTLLHAAKSLWKFPLPRSEETIRKKLTICSASFEPH